MLPEWKFNFNALKDLDNDLQASTRAIPIITQRVLQQEFRALRRELAPRIPRKTGAIRRHFTSSVRRGVSKVIARLGFIGRTTQRTAIAANVMQHGSHVMAKKATYLWIPLPGNRQITGEAVVSPYTVATTPSEYFVSRSKGGSLLAFRKEPGGGAVPIFALKKEINVPARPIPFEQRVIAELPRITNEITESIVQVVEAKRAAEQVITGGG